MSHTIDHTPNVVILEGGIEREEPATEENTKRLADALREEYQVLTHGYGEIGGVGRANLKEALANLRERMTQVRHLRAIKGWR